jgi:hypothetical protein
VRTVSISVLSTTVPQILGRVSSTWLIVNKYLLSKQRIEKMKKTYFQESLITMRYLNGDVLD